MKIAVLGAGNAGCFTALHYGFHTNQACEVELIHDPSIPPELVGQATFSDVPSILDYTGTGFNWYNNTVKATIKTGILYEGWGKSKEPWFHPFKPSKVAMHFCPSLMQNFLLKTGQFKVTESSIPDPDDVDADYVFDCRGKPNDLSEYKRLKNPINACILGRPNWKSDQLLWSKHVATPNGWTFVIPTNAGSPSYHYSVGYLYNSTITTKEDAEKNFLEMFDVEIQKHLTFDNYVAKKPIINGRVFLNGNRLFFLEPMESTALQTYIMTNRYIFDYLFLKTKTIKETTTRIHRYIEQIENFVLQHYHYGSNYDTPFWRYANRLNFKDEELELELKRIKMGAPSVRDGTPENYTTKQYGMWSVESIHNWENGMSRCA